MSDRRVRKGEVLERDLSKKLESNRQLFFLISSLVLRERECGQVDLAYFSKTPDWMLTLVEIKNGGVVSIRQRKRLGKSAEFLASLFDVNVRTKCVAKM